MRAFISFFLSDGTIESSDADFNNELNSVLNLNLMMLKCNRVAVLDMFKRSLDGRGALSEAELQRKCAKWSSVGNEGELKEYCQVVVYWIMKRIARPDPMNPCTEAAFETVLFETLLVGGYEEILRDGFDRERAIFPEAVLDFIHETQPTAWKKLEALSRAKTGEQVLT